MEEEEKERSLRGGPPQTRMGGEQVQRRCSEKHTQVKRGGEGLQKPPQTSSTHTSIAWPTKHQQLQQVPFIISVRSLQGVGADVGPLLQHLLGDLLDVGVVVLRGVWRESRGASAGEPPDRADGVRARYLRFCS